MGFAPGYIEGSAELPLTECESERQVSGIEGEWGQESGGLTQTRGCWEQPPGEESLPGYHVLYLPGMGPEFQFLNAS